MAALFIVRSERIESLAMAKLFDKRLADCSIASSDDIAGIEDLIEYVQSGHNPLFIPLTLPRFATLKFVEFVHRYHLKINVVLFSAVTGVDPAPILNLFTDFIHPSIIDLDEILNAIDRPTRSTWLTMEDVEQSIRDILDTAGCFRASHQGRKLDATYSEYLLANASRDAQSSSFTGELIMGDKYVTTQAGVVGPNAKVDTINLQQVADTRVSLNDLADSLAILRTNLRDKAKSAEEDISLGAVASAEDAARKGDEAGVQLHLKRAGQWALDVAQKICIPVAVDAIKAALK